MLPIFFAFAGIYILLLICLNAIAIDSLDIEILGVSHVAISKLDAVSQIMTALGISLFLVKVYLSRLHDPQIFRLPRALFCLFLVAVGTVVLSPAQSSAVNWIVEASPAEMRRDALKLVVANYGIVAGDVTINELEITSATYKTKEVRSALALMNPIFILSEGFEVVDSNLQPVTEVVLRNRFIENDANVSRVFDASMKASCLSTEALWAEFSKKALAARRDYYREKDNPDEQKRRAIGEAWQQTRREMFGFDTNLVPNHRTKPEFMDEAAVQKWMRNQIQTGISEAKLPSLFALDREKDVLLGYLHKEMAGRVLNPCQSNWSSFKKAGHRDGAINSTASYYATIVRDEYERLDEGGDLEQVGRGAMVMAIVPSIIVGMSIVMVVFHTHSSLSLWLLHYTSVARWARLAAGLSLLTVIALMPFILSHIVADTPAFRQRLSEVSSFQFPIGWALSVLFDWLIRLEQVVYSVGHEIYTLVVPDIAELFGGGNEDVKS